MKNYILIFCIFILFILSCENERKRKLSRELQSWQNKEIIFSPNLQAKILGKDTIIKIDNNKLKIINYIDTSGCTECRLELYEWSKKIEEIKSLSSEIEVIFIAYQKDYTDLEFLCKKNFFNYPIFYDKTNDMNKINNFPTSSLLQCFLIDQNNHIILIGNPIRNDNIWDLYKKAIHMNLSSKNTN